MKKRYQKKKNNLKKADRSGTSTAIVGKARKDFEPYLFFTWFDAYTRQRSSKSNIMCDNDSDSMVESYDKIDADDDGDGSSIDDMSDTESVSSDQIEIISKPACFIKPKEVGKRVNHNKEKRSCIKKSKTNDCELEMMKDITESIKRRRQTMDCENAKDPEDLFCGSLAAELRQLSERDRCMAKHEISNIIFKYQLAKFSPSSTDNRSLDGPYIMPFGNNTPYRNTSRSSTDNSGLVSPPVASNYEDTGPYTRFLNK